MEEKFEDTKRVIRRSKSKKNRQYNDKQKKEERTQNDLQNTTQKTKGRVTLTPVNIGSEFMCSGKVSSVCSTSDTCRDRLVANPVRNLLIHTSLYSKTHIYIYIYI